MLYTYFLFNHTECLKICTIKFNCFFKDILQVKYICLYVNITLLWVCWWGTQQLLAQFGAIALIHGRPPAGLLTIFFALCFDNILNNILSPGCTQESMHQILRTTYIRQYFHVNKLEKVIFYFTLKEKN